MARARWNSTSGSLVPSRFYSSELSDDMIQSVELRASGTDSFVEATTPVSRQQQLHTRPTIDRESNRPYHFELQSAAATSPEQAASYEGWTTRTALSSREALPEFEVLPSTSRRGGAADNHTRQKLTSTMKRAFDCEFGSGQQYDQEAMLASDSVGLGGISMTVGTVVPLSQLSQDKSAVAVASLSSLSLSSAMKTYGTNKQRRLQSSLPSTTASASVATQNATTLVESLPSNKRALSSSTSAGVATSSTGGTTTKRVRVKTERRREQCRTNQARYRNKQRAYRLELEQAVVQLRDEVSMLEARHHSLSYERRTSLSIWNVVVEYFRLFRHGALVNLPAAGRNSASDSLDRKEASTDSRASSTTSAVDLFLQSPYGQDQIAFLQSAMVPEVYYGGGSEETQGIEGLADQWIRTARCFDNFELQLDRMEKAPGFFDTIVATSRVRVTVSEATLRYVFPHLLRRRNSGGHGGDGQPVQLTDDDELARRLLGQRLEFKCLIWFECDQESSKVMRLRVQMDLVTPVMRALGSLRDAARALDGARMTSIGFLLVDEC